MTDMDRNSRSTVATTNSMGEFVVEKLIRGPYLVTASGQREPNTTVVFRQEVTLKNEGDTVLELRPPGTCVLSGTVVLPTNASDARVQVALMLKETQAFQGAVGEGRFKIVGLPEGECRVAVFYKLDGRLRVFNHALKIRLHRSRAVSVELDARR